jgi:hypothetical protein
VVCAVALAAPAAAHAQACEAGTISEIRFERLKPFLAEATAEDASAGWLFRGMNSIHARTRESTIRWEIHFVEGDCFDPALIEESGRALRSLPYLVEASVESERLADGTHRVSIRTLDAWALTLGVAFSFDGGVAITGISANAKNILGTGVQAGVFRNVFRERSRVGVLGRQPNLFGTRVDVALHGGSTRSGDYVSESLFRPFAGEVGTNAFRQGAAKRDDYFLYTLDDAVGFQQAYVRFEAEQYEATFQHRFGDEVGMRFLAGLGVSRESIRFPFNVGGVQVVANNDFDNPLPAPDEVVTTLSPQMRSHATNRVNFTLGVRSLRFRNRRGFDAMSASQDVILGTDLTVTVAPGVPIGDDNTNDLLTRIQGSFGADGARAYLRVDGDFQARRVSSDLNGGATGWRDIMYEINASAYWSQTGETSLFGRALYTAGYSLDRPFQLTVGGRESVRAYNEDAYPGARRLLATLEQRTPLPGWSTGFADLGFAFFADAGRVMPGSVPYGVDSGWKVGVGAGLRIGLPKGAQNVLRIDLGLPLSGDRDTKGVTFRIYTELFGLLDRRAWPTQTQRSYWYGIDPDLTTRPANPLAGN